MISILNKNIAIILIGATIATFFAPLAFFTPKAQAFLFDFSFEVNPAVWVNIVLQYLKEYALDAIAYGAASTVLSQTMDSLTKWAATGEWNAPLFVTDWRGFAINAADVALTEFDTYMKEQGYKSICTPFQKFIQLNIDMNLGNNPYNRTNQQRLTCTINQLKNNATAFANYIQNFENGGWEMFIKLNDHSSNPFGVYFEVLDAQNRSISLSAEARKNQALAGSGYTGNANKKGSNIKSPGDYVASVIKQHSAQQANHSAQADELSELLISGITNIVNGLFKRAITSLR